MSSIIHIILVSVVILFSNGTENLRSRDKGPYYKFGASAYLLWVPESVPGVTHGCLPHEMPYNNTCVNIFQLIANSSARMSRSSNQDKS